MRGEAVPVVSNSNLQWGLRLQESGPVNKRRGRERPGSSVGSVLEAGGQARGRKQRQSTQETSWQGAGQAVHWVGAQGLYHIMEGYKLVARDGETQPFSNCLTACKADVMVYCNPASG